MPVHTQSRSESPFIAAIGVAVITLGFAALFVVLYNLVVVRPIASRFIVDVGFWAPPALGLAVIFGCLTALSVSMRNHGQRQPRSQPRLLKPLSPR